MIRIKKNIYYKEKNNQNRKTLILGKFYFYSSISFAWTQYSYHVFPVLSYKKM